MHAVGDRMDILSEPPGAAVLYALTQMPVIEQSSHQRIVWSELCEDHLGGGGDIRRTEGVKDRQYLLRAGPENRFGCCRKRSTLLCSLVEEGAEIASTMPSSKRSRSERSCQACSSMSTPAISVHVSAG